MHFDTHVHSVASPDSEMLPEDAIEALAKQGLGCAFTEHVDFGVEGYSDFCTDLETYPKHYLKFRSSTVLIGLEIGLTKEWEERNRIISAAPVFDYIIGSVHVTSGLDLCFASELYEQLGKGLYRRHLNEMLEMVKSNNFFDALGHIDYVSRYSPLAEKNVLYNEYSEEYDNILHSLIEQGKLLEFNTRRLADNKARKNIFDIFSRYYSLGGRFVTIGSDAHTVEQLGYQYSVALCMLNEIGLVPVHFVERELNF